MFKIYQSREELMADIAGGSMGKDVKQTMRVHEAEQARKGKQVSFQSFWNALREWRME